MTVDNYPLSHGSLAQLDEDQHPIYVKKTGDTMTGALTVDQGSGRAIVSATSYGQVALYEDSNPGSDMSRASGLINSYRYDTGGTATETGRIQFQAYDDTDGSEKGWIRLFASTSSGLVEQLRLTGTEVNATFTRLDLKHYRETIVAHGTIADAGTLTVDPAAGTMHVASAGGNITVAESLANGDSILLRIYMGIAYAVTWPAGIRWPGGTAPTMKVGNNIVSLWEESGVIWGSSVGAYA